MVNYPAITRGDHVQHIDNRYSEMTFEVVRIDGGEVECFAVEATLESYYFKLENLRQEA